MNLINQHFVKETAKSLVGKNFLDYSSKNVKDFPINSKQALYIVDWQQSEVSFQRNIDKLLGYDEQEFKLETILDIAHPNDLELIKRITQTVVNHLVQKETYNLGYDNASLLITYRIRKKDGTYVKILRQSTLLARTISGLMKSNLSLLTDVSFFDKSETVHWEFEAPEIEQKIFRKKIYKEFETFFTKREKQIVQLIERNLKTREIATKLFISEHTVYSHRKNILRKSNCHNSAELIEFSKKIGVI